MASRLKALGTVSIAMNGQRHFKTKVINQVMETALCQCVVFSIISCVFKVRFAFDSYDNVLIYF